MDPVNASDSPDVSIETDTSKLGWGACFNGNKTGGLWSLLESENHINYLETLATFFALKCFHIRAT